MQQIKLLNKISPNGLKLLPQADYKYGEDVENPDGILVRSASLHEMEFGENLQAIARAGAGVNNIPIDKCSDVGICVFNTPGANANAVKEMAIMGLFMSSRRVFASMQWAQTLKGKGAEVPKLVEKGKSDFTGPEVAGKKLGVIGLGMIGIMVSNTAIELGMEVFGYDPFLSVDAAFKINKDVNRVTSLSEIYSQCDFITLHLPSIAETRGMINAETLALCKPGVRILNFSRGDLVESDDMVAALDEGQVRCYLTDFPDDTLLGHAGVLAIPHLGASTPESEENCAVMAVQQIKDYLESGNVVNSINLPDLQVPRSGRSRITVIHKNEPSMISQISGLVEGNINNLSTNSRKSLGYIIMDLDTVVEDSLIEQINKITGVIRVRYFK